MMASVLLVLSLEALLLAGLVAGGGDIRLPSDGKGLAAGEVMATMVTTRATNNGGEQERPWECCDMVISPLIILPMFRCLDRVEQCAAACKNCVEVEHYSDDPLRYMCLDWYRGDNPGPRCTDDEEMTTAAAKKEKKAGDEEVVEERPWECCDVALCTRSFPPICTCTDMVESCAAACKRCDLVDDGSPPLYRCRDMYRGEPGPRCRD